MQKESARIAASRKHLRNRREDEHRELKGG